MRVPDRRAVETNADGCEGSGRLADRLTRLPAGHPSADGAARDRPGSDGPETADLEFDDPESEGRESSGREYDDREPDERAPDDLESTPVGPSERGYRAPHRPRGSAEPVRWVTPGGEDRSPYRPWFSSDGASDPWFAEPLMSEPLADE
jgi:hypothetical protein